MLYKLILLARAATGFMATENIITSRQRHALQGAFLAPCDRRKHTDHAHQPTAVQCAVPVLLLPGQPRLLAGILCTPQSSVASQHPVGHVPLRNKALLTHHVIWAVAIDVFI